MVDRDRVTRVIRFLISGCSAAAVEYFSFVVIFQYLHQQLILSNVLSFILGLVTSFLLNKHWVFKNSTDTLQQLVRYFTLAVINLGLGTGIIWVLVNELLVPALFSKLLVMGVIAVWNYVIFSKLIFNHVSKNKDDTI